MKKIDMSKYGFDGWYYVPDSERKKPSRRRVRRDRRRPLGVVLYRGLSPWNKEPYAVVATFESKNDKTGNMVQIWILRENATPVADRKEAIDHAKSQSGPNGANHTVCGGCPFIIAGCYVSWENAPTAIHTALANDRYPTYEPAVHDHWFMGRELRFGAAGDPCLIPVDLCDHLVGVSCLGNGPGAGQWTGYTQQWRRPEFQCFRHLFMASVHSKAQRDLAWSLGWRTFRDCESLDAEPIDRGEFGCPASKEGGMRLQCIDCCACNGADREVHEIQRASVVTVRHPTVVQKATLNKAIREGRISLDS